jgi:hypothetical protein
LSGKTMRISVTIASLSALLTASAASAQSQQVPNLDIAPVCRGIAAHPASPGESGGPDLSFKSCLSSELKVRRTLQRQWTHFSAASRAQCIADTTSGLSSYTDLLTCLQVSRDLKQFHHHAAQR